MDDKRVGIDLAVGEDRTAVGVVRGGKFLRNLPDTTDPTLWRMTTLPNGDVVCAHPECAPVTVARYGR